MCPVFTSAVLRVITTLNAAGCESKAVERYALELREMTGEDVIIAMTPSELLEDFERYMTEF